MKILTFWLIIFFLAIITIFGLVTENITAKKAEITKLQQGMAELQTSVNELQGALDQKDEYIFELKSRVTELEGYINAAELLKASPRDALKVIVTARENNIKPSLMLALASVESDGNKYLISKNPGSIDIGIMQLNSRTYRRFSTSYLLNVNNNIELATQHIVSYLNKGFSETDTLMAYNMGEGGFNRFRSWNSGLTAYCKKILAMQKQFDFIT